MARLVIPTQHVASILDLSDDGQAAISRLVAQVRAKLMTDLTPDGFNIGANDGVAAGQTVNQASSGNGRFHSNHYE